MNNSRDKIFSQIRASLPNRENMQDKLRERMLAMPRGILPTKAKLPATQLHELFITQARQVSTHVEKINSLSAAPQHIISILQQQQLPLSIRAAADVALAWEQYPALSVKTGVAIDSDKVSVTSCLCGVAETGTLVLLSGHGSPTTLNFLPEIHIVLLSTKNIVAYYEDAWDLVRANKILPRTINFITGPSRTGDIEQTVQIGMHGPKQLFILLYNE